MKKAEVFRFLVLALAGALCVLLGGYLERHQHPKPCVVEPR